MVDTNIVIDLLEPDGAWFAWSRLALASARTASPVAASAIVVGELADRHASAEEGVEQLAHFGITCRPIDAVAAHRAGLAQSAYRVAGGQRTKLLGDFLIGAHAETVDATLLTRDSRRYRQYFPDLTLITPETHP